MVHVRVNLCKHTYVSVFILERPNKVKDNNRFVYVSFRLTTFRTVNSAISIITPKRLETVLPVGSECECDEAAASFSLELLLFLLFRLLGSETTYKSCLSLTVRLDAL